MKKIIFIIWLFICLGFANNHPKGRPTSQLIDQRSQKTNLFFTFMNSGLNSQSIGVDESTIFQRTFSKKEPVTDWVVDTLSPFNSANDNNFAWQYYNDVPGVVWISNYDNLPDDVIWIGKTLFCDETEVCNLDWIEFLQLSGYAKKHTAGNLTMEKINYNFNSQFYYFPVVNISYEDAVAYCEWRTKIVTDRYNQEKGFSKDSQEYTIFKFRLPSKKEWLKCASFGTDTITYPHLFTKTDINTTIHKKSLSFLRLLGAKITENNIIEFNKYEKQDFVFNCKRSKNSYLNLETPYYIWDYPTNNYGIYNIMGNVSEMIAEKGLSMGGSFRNTYEECVINKTFLYHESSDDLGFRCVCELKFPNK